ncbi:class IIb bacteriocin, lactobin A/cerein 7B family [Neisseria weixii]|uniref:Class IIb bacteriocin, lactobin A/cerein 7B family n=1 Tax=Neisseria weixii TaxID=1853276 RepID=A0A3N4MX17_9NEIS|nr:class IIb bacteriocin, lactobin A/cerein 7B family [Neisseria weixii]RPD83749.1 class IIb bacteriocin, lactobin A/cerein 7B family [Neisseria weixii]RPD84295.1 class IIb bacteriocin, lactobin A/cerein 7B family [Neisseria weixii]
MKVLTYQDLENIQGGFGPIGAVVGAAGGAAGYLVEQQISGSKFSPTALGTYVLGGAAAGGTAGPMGVIWGFNGALAGGSVRGVAARQGW